MIDLTAAIRAATPDLPPAFDGYSLIAQTVVTQIAPLLKVNDSLARSFMPGINIASSIGAQLSSQSLASEAIKAVIEPALAATRPVLPVPGIDLGPVTQLVGSGALLMESMAPILAAVHPVHSLIGHDFDTARRLGRLVRGFEQTTGGPFDVLGRIQQGIDTSSSLVRAIDDAAQGLATPTGLGFDFDRVRSALDAADRIVEEDPEVAGRLEAPSREAMRLVEDDDDDLIDFSNVFALGRGIRSGVANVSGSSVFVALTYFMLRSVMEQGMYQSTNLVTTAIETGALYIVVKKLIDKNRGPQD